MIASATIAFSAAIALLVGWFLIFPLFEDSRESADTNIDQNVKRLDAEVRQEVYLRSLEELEIDFRAGVIDASDYQEMHGELVREAAKLEPLLEGSNK